MKNVVAGFLIACAALPTVPAAAQSMDDPAGAPKQGSVAAAIDPTGTIHRYSADDASAYLTSSRLQIIPAATWGVNRFTPQTQLYAGTGTRF